MFKKFAPLMLLFLVACTDDPVEPNTDPREKFLGNWNVREEITGSQPQNYTSVVTENPGNADQIIISNIYNLGAQTSVTASVSNNSLSLITSDVTGITISGTGLFSGSSFVLNYTAEDGEVTTVKATYTR